MQDTTGLLQPQQEKPRKMLREPPIALMMALFNDKEVEFVVHFCPIRVLFIY